MKNFLFVLFAFFAGVSMAQLNVDSLSHISYQALHQANLNDVWGYVDEEGNEYAIVGTSKGTSIVNITNPQQPQEVFWLEGTESIWRDPCVWGNYAYITTEANDGLTIIDLSPLPQSQNLPVTMYVGTETNPLLSAHTCFVDEEGYAYIFGSNRGNRGVQILDIHTNPMFPMEVGVFDNWYCHDGYVRNDTMYLGHIYDGIFSLVDVSDRSNPVLIATQSTPNLFAHNIWPSTNGQYVFTTDEVSGAYIGVYDISNASQIKFVDKIQHSPGKGVVPHNTHVKGDYLVTSYYSDGIIIHDATYPYNLIKVGQYDSYPGQTIGFDGCWGAYPFFPSGTIIASDITQGLFILGPHYHKAAYLEGIVKDELSGAVLNDVKVKIVGNDQLRRTNAQGWYATGMESSGTYSVRFEKVGYYPKSISVDLVQGQLSTIETLMTPIPPFECKIMLRDVATNSLIPNANLKLIHPLITHEGTTNGLGERVFSLFYREQYEVIVGKWGFISKCEERMIDESTLELTYFLEKGIYDDFEFDYGWNVTSDASTGTWVRGVPNPTNNTVMDYDAPLDCGHQAFVTGNEFNSNPDFDDVDNGSTVLISPQFDLTSFSDPHINFACAFYCFHGPALFDDTIEVYLSNGTETVLIDFWGAPQGNPMEWVYKSIPVSGLLPFNNSMQLRVKISDLQPNRNITEGAFDHFRVTNGSTVAVEEKSITSLLFPNPTSDFLRFKSVLENQNFEILGLEGKRYLNGFLTTSNDTIDVRDLQVGMYFLRLENAVFPFVKK